jgi:hypothetical protein
MRTSFLFLAVAMAAMGCGDDTVATTGSGGGSTSGTTTGSTSGSPTSSTTTTSSTGEGGGPGSTGSGDGGSTGDGGSAGDGGGGVGGFEPGETVTEACQNFNLMNEAFADELGCVLAEPCARQEPDMCADELLAFFNCRLENTTIDECSCDGGGGEGGSGQGGGDAGDIFCEDLDGACATESAELDDCFFG